MLFKEHMGWNLEATETTRLTGDPQPAVMFIDPLERGGVIMRPVGDMRVDKESPYLEGVTVSNKTPKDPRV